MSLKWYEILFLAAYGCLTLTLIILKLFKIGSKRRGAVKMITSLSFVAVAIYAATLHGGLAILACIALCFASLGDFFLVFRANRKIFILGVMSFFVNSVLLSAYSLANFGLRWWALIMFAVLFVANVLCQKFKVYSYGRNKVYLNLYTVAVNFCGCLGFSLLFQGELAALLFGLGCFCYFASDVFLGLYLYKLRSRVIIDAINSLLYFPGMLLVALSLCI